MTKEPLNLNLSEMREKIIDKLVTALRAAVRELDDLDVMKRLLGAESTKAPAKKQRTYVRRAASEQPAAATGLPERIPGPYSDVTMDRAIRLVLEKHPMINDDEIAMTLKDGGYYFTTALAGRSVYAQLAKMKDAVDFVKPSTHERMQGMKTRFKLKSQPGQPDAEGGESLRVAVTRVLGEAAQQPLSAKAIADRLKAEDHHSLRGKANPVGSIRWMLAALKKGRQIQTFRDGGLATYQLSNVEKRKK